MQHTIELIGYNELEEFSRVHMLAQWRLSPAFVDRLITLLVMLTIFNDIARFVVVNVQTGVRTLKQDFELIIYSFASVWVDLWLGARRKSLIITL